MRFFKNRKRLFFIIIPLVLLLVLYLFRFPILRSMGHYLVSEDSLQQAEVIFVLSGSANSRAVEGAKIYRQGYGKRIICTGREISIPKIPDSCDDSIITSELTRKFLVANGVPQERIELLVKGTSTWEEFEAIRDYVLERQLTTVMIVSSKYHTRRIRKVFSSRLEKIGVKAVIRGADDPFFHPDSWWKNESGLIAVNNEYVKLIYYAFKY